VGLKEVNIADDRSLRQLLSKALAWEDAHVSFDTVTDGVPAELRGERPAGIPHSLWQLVEHLRITQYDILDFCRNSSYEEMKWPDDYWPADPAPPNAAAWDESIKQFRRDRQALQDLAADTSVDLEARIPHGSGQTYLRELVLVADHSAYHIGQIVLVRRLLGIWPAAA
jgi:uncharacterized damage-inducible protein DinB